MAEAAKTYTRNLVPLLALAALLLAFGAPATAEPPAEQDCGDQPALLDTFTPEAVLFGSAPAPTGASVGDIGAQSTCIATCGDGTSVVCSSGGSCTADDSDCSGSRGTCTDDSGTKYCPYACCSNLTSCVDRHGTGPCLSFTNIKCSSSSGHCGSCFCSNNTWVCEMEAQ